MPKTYEDRVNYCVSRLREAGLNEENLLDKVKTFLNSIQKKLVFNQPEVYTKNLLILRSGGFDFNKVGDIGEFLNAEFSLGSRGCFFPKDILYKHLRKNHNELIAFDTKFQENSNPTNYNFDVYFGLEALRKAGYLSNDNEVEQAIALFTELTDKASSYVKDQDTNKAMIDSLCERVVIRFAKLKQCGYGGVFALYRGGAMFGGANNGLNENMLKALVNPEDTGALQALNSDLLYSTVSLAIRGISLSNSERMPSEMREVFFMDAQNELANSSNFAQSLTKLHFLDMVTQDNPNAISFIERYKITFNDPKLLEAAIEELPSKKPTSEINRKLFALKNGLFNEVTEIANGTRQSSDSALNVILNNLKQFDSNIKIQINWDNVIKGTPLESISSNSIVWEALISVIKTLKPSDALNCLSLGTFDEKTRWQLIDLLEKNQCNVLAQATTDYYISLLNQCSSDDTTHKNRLIDTFISNYNTSLIQHAISDPKKISEVAHWLHENSLSISRVARCKLEGLILVSLYQCIPSMKSDQYKKDKDNDPIRSAWKETREQSIQDKEIEGVYRSIQEARNISENSNVVKISQCLYSFMNNHQAAPLTDALHKRGITNTLVETAKDIDPQNVFRY